MKKSLVILIVIFSSFFLYSNPASYNDAKVLYQQGLNAFALGNHLKAIEIFSSVEHYLNQNSTFKKNFDHHYREFSMVQMVKNHQNLGKINPLIKHRILAVFVKETKALFKGIKVEGKWNTELEQNAITAQEVCKKYFEVLSNGKISLNFDRVTFDGVLTKIYGEKFLQGDHESINPYPSSILYELSKKYDTVVFYFNNGTASIPNSHFTGNASLTQIALIPGFLYGPLRGRIVISSALSDRPGTLFHELFHVLEQFYKIKPSHGYLDENRNTFPEWKGNGEMDYYQFHFKKLFNYENFVPFIFVDSYPVNLNKDLFSKVVQAYNRLTLSDKRKYLEVLSQIPKIKNPDTEYQLLIDLYPYNENVLKNASVYQYSKGNKKKAYDLILKAYELNPLRSDICYYAGVFSYHQSQFEESIKFFTEGIKLEPSARFYQYRGMVYFYMGLNEKGAQDYKRLYNISPSHREWIKKDLESRKKNKNPEAAVLLKELFNNGNF